MTGIDSENVEERIAALVGIKCQNCLDTGFVMTYVDGKGWQIKTEVDAIADGDGQRVPRILRCDCGKDHGY